jgi:histidinol-phosphate aminotransferase
MNSIAQLAVTREIGTSYASIEQILLTEKYSSEPIRLHCNETPFDLPEELKQQLTLKMAEMAWNRYPDFHNTELTALIAEKAGVQFENILLGNGSSQLIQQIVNCCSKFLSTAVIEHPTFTLYHQVCQNERMPYQEWVLAEDGSYNLDTFLEYVLEFYLASLLIIMEIKAILNIASELSTVFSTSRNIRRLKLSQPKLRSTGQRFFSGTKP